MPWALRGQFVTESIFIDVLTILYKTQLSRINSVLREELIDHVLKAEACEVLKASYERGWISTRDGNVSVRAEGGRFHVSPSGVRKHSLRPDSFLLVDATGFGGPGQPSGELELHRQVQALLPEGWTTVLHVHATYTVAALYAGYTLPALAAGFPEVSRYTRVGTDVPALPATSDSLADATGAAFRATALPPHIVGLDRHGVVAIGRDPWDAFEHVERLEHICKMVLSASTSACAMDGALGARLIAV
jgi:ribulose-5-phosphate 4-epimerase/fuculose-1-phosphate aldolase